MATYAGRYDEILLRNVGGRTATPAPNTTVTVYQSDGTTLASLYTNRTKTPGTNPVSPDAAGNLEFFADPGTYVLKVYVDSVLAATNTVPVHPDPAEVDALLSEGGTIHDASNIGFVAGGSIGSVNVQDAIVEVADEAADAHAAHLSDPTAAHSASAVSTTPPGWTSDTNAQALITTAFESSSATVGLASIDAGDLVLDIETPWGIDPIDGPYYDPGAVTPGEEALFSIESGLAGWLLITEVA